MAAKKEWFLKNLARFPLPLIAQRIGLSLVLVMTACWVLTFPTLKLIIYGFSPDPSLFTPVWKNGGLTEFFYRFPQLLWLGFLFGIILLFWFRSVPARAEEASDQGSRFEIAGLSLNIQGWAYFSWRTLGLVSLLLILILAAIFRIGDARDLGATDLVRSDFDEGVHASAAMLMAQGKQVYRDFFLTQPPLGIWLWSLPMRFGGAEWGSLLDFVRLRNFTSILSIITIALVYLTGLRLGGRLGGPVAGAIAALTLALDGGAIRTEQQIMLEGPANLFAGASLCAFVHFDPLKKQSEKFQKVVISLAGIMAGLSFAVKAPTLLVIFGLGLSLVSWHRWRLLPPLVLGFLAAYFLSCGYFLVSDGGSLIKQAYLYRIIHPFSAITLFKEFKSSTTLTAFDYLDRSPFLALTLLGAVVGLVGIVFAWVRGKGGANWLPLVLITALTALSLTAKVAFYPHYYDQLAPFLALMAGGIVNFWRVSWWRTKTGAIVSLTGILAVGLLLGPALLHAREEPSRPEWSIERALAKSFEELNLKPGSLLTWDSRFSFILGLPPPRDGNNQFLIDSSAGADYISLGFEQNSLLDDLYKAFGGLKLDDHSLRQLRYTIAIQGDLLLASEKADYVLLEARSSAQLTEETTRKLQTSFVNLFDSNELSLLESTRQVQYHSTALFGDSIRLIGLNTSGETTGTKIPLKVVWQGKEKMDQDYVIFLHLLDETGKKVAQRDTPPRYGALNTSKWEPGVLLEDDQSLDLPSGLPGGKYRLIMGIYRPADIKLLDLTGVPAEFLSQEGSNTLILMDLTLSPKGEGYEIQTSPFSQKNPEPGK